jgi:hypothetical protein
MTTARSAGEASPPGDTPGSTPAGHRVRRGTARPRMRRAATGGAVLASWAVLVAWLIASAPPLAPPADAADRGPDTLAEVPIADPSLLLSVVAPRPIDAATVDGAAATIPGSTAIPAVTGIIDLPVDGAGAVTVTPDGRQAWITHPDRG